MRLNLTPLPGVLRGVYSMVTLEERPPLGLLAAGVAAVRLTELLAARAALAAIPVAAVAAVVVV